MIYFTTTPPIFEISAASPGVKAPSETASRIAALAATASAGRSTQSVVLDRSQIVARAVLGHGGNVVIGAGEFIESADSLVSASSELGISGAVEIAGPRVNLNGSLVACRACCKSLRRSCMRAAAPSTSSSAQA